MKKNICDIERLRALEVQEENIIEWIGRGKGNEDQGTQKNVYEGGRREVPPSPT